jgi:hypothetical protein
MFLSHLALDIKAFAYITGFYLRFRKKYGTIGEYDSVV